MRYQKFERFGTLNLTSKTFFCFHFMSSPTDIPWMGRSWKRACKLRSSSCCKPSRKVRNPVSSKLSPKPPLALSSFLSRTSSYKCSTPRQNFRSRYFPLSYYYRLFPDRRFSRWPYSVLRQIRSSRSPYLAVQLCRNWRRTELFPIVQFDQWSSFQLLSNSNPTSTTFCSLLSASTSTPNYLSPDSSLFSGKTEVCLCCCSAASSRLRSFALRCCCCWCRCRCWEDTWPPFPPMWFRVEQICLKVLHSPFQSIQVSPPAISLFPSTRSRIPNERKINLILTFLNNYWTKNVDHQDHSR